MSIISPPGAPKNAVGDAAGSQWSLGEVLARAVVILIGIAAGCFVGVFVGLLKGWIEIQC